MTEGAASGEVRDEGQLRQAARDIFLHTLGEITVARAFERRIHIERGTLQIGDDLFDLQAFSRVLVISIGKAAHTMVEALARQAGSGLSGIVATPVATVQQVEGFRYFLGGHPLPNSESVSAAQHILRALRGLNREALVIYLISGGGSAVAEEPSDPAITLDDLIATYRTLVLSGAPIGEINAIRKHLSAVKGGRLAKAAGEAQQVSVLVSDVPDHQLDALASGPTMPDRSTAAQCYEIARRYSMEAQFPPPVRSLFGKKLLEETPNANDPAFARARWWTVLSNASAIEAASAKARELGYAVEVDNSVDDWDYVAAADHLLAHVRELRRKAPRVCLLSGGEVTVKVTNGGAGGRNQQFALYCATKIAGENVTVLSAGTDGIDGNSTAAGAVVDGTTVARMQAHGVDPTRSLRLFDANPALARIGDAVVTGPTGNNVRDLRIVLAP